MRNHWSRLIATAALAAILLVAACDIDDENDSPDATPTAPVATSPTAVAPPPIAAIDPCTLRTSLEGRALVEGPGFELGDLGWQLCIGGAAAGSSEKFLFRTEDAGVTWTLISRTTLGNPPPEAGVGEVPNGNAVEVIYFLNAGPGWLGLSSPGENLFRSDDGGVTWTFVDALPPGLPVSEIEFSDANNGTLTTPDGEWETTDGGDTWTEAP